MNNLAQFTPATEYTRDCFNRWDLAPYDAILEYQMREAPYAPYDLTILVGDPSSVYGKHYRIATGCHVYPFIYKNKVAAADALIAQYRAIRQPIAA